MKGVLSEIGIAGAAIARETPDGLMLIDGHLRTECLDDVVPVLVLDVDEDEADKLLATFDTVSSLAGVDQDRLEALLVDLPDFAADDVNQMLVDLSVQSGIAMSDWQSPIVDQDGIGDYDAEEETGIIRVKVKRSDRDEVKAKIEKALENWTYDLQMF